VGLICPRKNQADVISMAREVVLHFPKTYFLLVGNAEQDYLHDLKVKVEQFGLQQNVFFCDYTSDIGYYICGSDLMLHTASREPQGRVFLEAMAGGLPVVAYNVGGVSEAVINGETGYLLPYGDLNGLVQTVCMLIDNQNDRKLLGDSGHQRVKDHYSAEKAAELVREVINQVLVNR
jgi:glycosyltransferase involved in cell wall biosynthesis